MSSKAVVETPDFGRAKAELETEVPRLDEIVEGITWVLERDPRRFPQVRGTRLHRALTDAFPGAPALRIWYTYDILSRTVHLLWIERANGHTWREDAVVSIFRGLRPEQGRSIAG